MTIEMDMEVLLAAYQKERIADEHQCDQAIYGIENAVDYLVEVMCRKNGTILLRKDILRIQEAEKKLCEAITDIVVKPFKETT